jgi:hypothetical protein
MCIGKESKKPKWRSGAVFPTLQCRIFTINRKRVMHVNKGGHGNCGLHLLQSTKMLRALDNFGFTASVYEQY